MVGLPRDRTIPPEALPLAAPLCAGFLRRWQGNPAAVDAVALGLTLAERLESARGVWPQLAADPIGFAEWLGDRTPRGDAIAWLRALHVDDLYLTHACVGRQRRALHAFETCFVARVPTYLASLRPSAQAIEAAQQDLRIRLLVEERGAMPRIAGYTGTGSLDGWVRVAAIRIALDRVHAESRRGSREIDPDHTDDVVAPGIDVERGLVEARHRDDFAAAFREAFAALPTRDRSLLRLTFVESLTPGRIAQRYAVHRTTVMRWLQSAEHALRGQLRVRVKNRLRASEEECDGLLAVLSDGLSITIGSLLPPDTSS